MAQGKAEHDAIRRPLETSEQAVRDDILLHIRSRLPNLSRADGKIADFVLSEPDQISVSSLEEISSRCDTSAASVSRFAGRLGFPSFRSFQIALARRAPIAEDDEDDILFSNAPTDEVIRKIFRINQSGLAETELLLNKSALARIARSVAKSRRVILFGVGGSGVIASDGALRLSQLGICAFAYADSYQALVATSHVAKGDTVILISHSGETKPTLTNLQRARDNGAFVAAMTNYANSPLALLAGDNVLLTVYRERRIHAARTSSHVAQLCTMDCLYFLVAQIKADKMKKKVDALEEEIHREIR
jgi:DNA-binding MurR/RpiR family transcriptional regulator